MRPVRLELEGFTSFRQNASVDFRVLDLFVITGPTGAGKTSLIDAIIYALFGKTPRIGEKDASALISQGVERMKILLEFRARKKNYRLLRTLKRGSSQKLQLEVQESSGEWEALSNRVFEVRAKIEEIVGIDFDGFIKSIVLPQGEFDRFLRGDPVERRKILSDLLHLGIYEEMGKRARQIEQNTRVEQSTIEQFIETTYADVTEDRKAALKGQLEALSDYQKQLSEELTVIRTTQPLALELSNQRAAHAQATRDVGSATQNLKKAQASSAAAKDAAGRHKKRIDTLEELIAACGYNNERHLELKSLIPHAQEREQCERAITDAQTAHKKLNTQISQTSSIAGKTKTKFEQLANELKLKDQAVQRAKKEIDAATKQYGSPDAILQVVDDLKTAEEQIKEKAELQQSIADAEQQITENQLAITEVKDQLHQAEAEFKEAKAALDELQQQHAAIEIRRQLKKGEPCPVCEQTVAVLPALGKHIALQRAKDLLDQREKARDKYKALVLKKQHISESLPIQLKALKKNYKGVETSIATATAKAERILGKPPGKGAVNQLQKLAEQLSLHEAEYEAITSKFRDVHEAEAAAREDHINNEHQISLFSQQLEGLNKTINEKTARLAQLKKLLTGQPGHSVLAQELKEMEKAQREQQAYDREKKEERTQYESSEKQYLVAQTEAASCQQRLAELQSAISAATTSVDQLEKEIRTYISVPKGNDEFEYLDQRRSSLERESRELAGNIVTVQKDLDFVVRSLAD